MIRPLKALKALLLMLARRLQEVPAACPGEAPYPVSDASTTTPTED